MVTFPIDMFLPGSDLAPLKARKREFYDGLTRWKSDFAQAAPGSAKMLAVEGASYEDALTKANNLLLTNLWGDGLPLWPATHERVDWILRGSGVAAHARARQVPAARRRHHRRDLRHRARDGGRPARVPAGAGRRRRGVPRIRRLRPVAGDFRRAVPGRHRQRTDRETDPPQLGLRPARPGPAASRRGEHRARAAPPAAERRRRAAGRRHDGDLRRHALHQRGLRRGRGGAAAGLAAARDPAPRLRAGHELGLGRLRERGHQRPAARREEGDAGGGRAERHVAHGGLHAHAQPRGARGMGEGHARHHDDRADRRAQRMAELGWTQSSIREFLWENSKIPMEQMRRAGAPAWIEIDANPGDAREHQARSVADLP